MRGSRTSFRLPSRKARSLTDSSRYGLTALRQALGAAVRWNYLTRDPAVEAGTNPEPPREELLPFAREQDDTLAVELGLLYGLSRS